MFSHWLFFMDTISFQILLNKILNHLKFIFCFLFLVSSDDTSLLVEFGAFLSRYWLPSPTESLVILIDHFYLRISLLACSVNHGLSSGPVKEGYSMPSRESESSLSLPGVGGYLDSAPRVPKAPLTSSLRQTFDIWCQQGRRLFSELFYPRFPSTSCILWLWIGIPLNASFSWTCFDFLSFCFSLDQVLSFFYISAFPKNFWKIDHIFSYFLVLLDFYSL